MNKPHLLGAVCACVIITISSSTFSAIINQVDYFSLTNVNLIDFESLPPADPFPFGTVYDGIINLPGASFAERFTGQTLTPIPINGGLSDVLSGTPTSGLSLQTGAALENLDIVRDTSGGGNGTNVINGLGPNDPFAPAFVLGTGAMAILLDNDWSEFGLQVTGGNGGTATFQFWARDGSLVDTIALAMGTFTSAYFGFSRENGTQDIAGISIWNDDPAGIGYDDIIFGASGISSVPVPAAVWLFSSGLIGLIGMARRKQVA